MKKTLALLLISFCSGIFMYAQTPDNCRFVVNKTDEFTGEKILVTTSTRINQPAKNDYRFTFSFANVIDRDNLLPPSKYMNIKLSTVNESLFIAKGDPLFIKLNNNEVVELYAMDDYKTVATPSKPGVTITQVEANYEASNDVLVKIKQVGIAKIQMNTNQSSFNLNVKKQDNKKLADTLICVVDI